MSFYEQNLQALVQKNPKLATKLFSVKENKNFEVFVDEKDPLNVNIADIKNISKVSVFVFLRFRQWCFF